MNKSIVLLLSVWVLGACSHRSDIEMLKNRLAEAQTAVELSAQNSKRLEDTYSDIYFELNSLTVANFKAKVAAGETFYAYIGRPSCSDCNSFEPMFKRYIKQYRLQDKIYFVNVHRLHQDKNAWQQFKQQYQMNGTPTLAKFSKGRQINRLDLVENGGKISPSDLERWLDRNRLR